ncbi:hypothetical protein M011DRAFT_523944 [Sporormia fimetaria CBS 119925]|uniref:Uncharacterized protein n=1 Tax=Sporormia fimetaria CBS 119925 TaxID=1340428 RepID=A0A6A6VMU3_9PLEO|nr:hypothetical protein M011DRAFT_523944 [Sporormia fimetaria CBS 119925]
MYGFEEGNGGRRMRLGETAHSYLSAVGSSWDLYLINASKHVLGCVRSGMDARGQTLTNWQLPPNTPITLATFRKSRVRTFYPATITLFQQGIIPQSYQTEVCPIDITSSASSVRRPLPSLSTTFYIDKNPSAHAIELPRWLPFLPKRTDPPPTMSTSLPLPNTSYLRYSLTRETWRGFVVVVAMPFPSPAGTRAWCNQEATLTARHTGVCITTCAGAAIASS